MVRAEVKPRLKGRAFLIRYADDAVLVSRGKETRDGCWTCFPKRFGKYGLTLHPEKTRLVPFQRPAPKYPNPKGTAGPNAAGIVRLLGLHTILWTRSLKGNWAVKRKTAEGRFSRSLTSVAQWCREHRHLPIEEQWVALTSEAAGALRVLRDHRQYREPQQLPVPRDDVPGTSGSVAARTRPGSRGSVSASWSGVTRCPRLG